MRVLILLSAMAFGCGGDGSPSPDTQKLGDFDDFSIWGSGMDGHSAPTSAGGDGDGDGDGDADGGIGDDTGDATTGPDTGACVGWSTAECVDTDESSCAALGSEWEYYATYTCEQMGFGSKGGGQ